MTRAGEGAPGGRGPIALPDCQHWQGRFHLSAEQKRQLIQLLATKGPQALDAYIAEQAEGDSLLARRIAAWRKELLARAEAMKRALEEQFAARKSQAEREAEERERALHGQRDALEQELQRFRLTRDVQLTEVLQRSELVRAAEGPARRTLRERVLAFLARLWFGLLRRLGVRKQGRTMRAVLPGLLALDGLRLRNALHSDAMRARVRSRLRAMPPRERLRRLRDQLLGRDDYESLAMRLMEDELARERDAKQRELGERESALAQRLQELAELERRERHRLAEEEERLERERQEALRKLREKAEQEPVRKLREEVQEELGILGYLKQGAHGDAVTSRLIGRFSELVFEDEMKALNAGHRPAYGSYVEGEGVFRKEPLLMVDELSHMDLVGSAVQARMRHPRQRHIYDDDVLVHREMRTSTAHVVLIFDTSGSMEENQRLDAAKRAALALWQAARRANRSNRVDLVLMETSVRRADILDAWLARPRGFTNTGGALALARALLERSRSDRKLVYLITDGLPEAMTLPNGEDIASYPDKCLAYALDEARRLKALPGLGFAVLLLEPEDEQYVKAAERIARVLEGQVLPTDPKELARKVLLDFERARKAVAAPAGVRG